ncbi:MAG: Nif3-like dinuclear metal center hexameric protein [Lactobacillus sp.]|jgi:dinuclear metal center YbgI/SA1388 family protein|nr:Nif3-like dinuclear metal center hexameric protein [Lactobacillus sp.]MCH3906251.1 Nif3-like dinuclear metal center hexameric protein [Lactobacillus sp.]MCH3990173.1 Nif3-like dinuclear metal center hexameric protein [Lactobacillus sp.]MCH4069113.1 Nif3-like dinuclear metal center hexameric protein [Lactobacillus sp.]MCI1303900.1 Nif3-like dinuclear metal center hexameric protein [Lactobacillus sp.]
MTKVKDIIAQLQKFFPEDLAVQGDPVGMQIGDPEAEVTKVMTTLDVRPQVVQEAIDQQVDFIVSHHPVIFRPAKNLDFTDPQMRMYGDLIKHGIAVYAIHTNSDKAQNGSSQWEAEALDLEDINPFCLDLDGIAIGRRGELPQVLTAREFADYVKDKLQVDFVRLITGDNQRPIKRVGLVCGDGNKFWPEAVKAGLDAYVTGDVYYHTGHDIISNGLTVVDPGHYTEKLFKYKVAELLQKWAPALKWQVEIIISQVSTDPFQNLS